MISGKGPKQVRAILGIRNDWGPAWKQIKEENVRSRPSALRLFHMTNTTHTCILPT